MGFNYGYEKKKFDSRWKRLEVEYCDAGMSEEQIAAMKEYDWAWFCSQRVFQNHTQPIPCEQYDEVCGQSQLFRKFASLSCKNRHPSPICTRFEHHFHALKPHLHRRSFSDTLPENQRHLIALKRHPLWHMQKLCQLSQPAELRSTFFRNGNAVLCQDVLQLSNPLALSLEFFLSCVKVFHRLTLHLVVAGPFQF